MPNMELQVWCLYLHVLPFYNGNACSMPLYGETANFITLQGVIVKRLYPFSKISTLELSKCQRLLKMDWLQFSVSHGGRMSWVTVISSGICLSRLDSWWIISSWIYCTRKACLALMRHTLGNVYEDCSRINWGKSDYPRTAPWAGVLGLNEEG